MNKEVRVRGKNRRGVEKYCVAGHKDKSRKRGTSRCSLGLCCAMPCDDVVLGSVFVCATEK